MEKWQEYLRLRIEKRFPFPWHCVYIYSSAQEAVKAWEEFFFNCKKYQPELLLVLDIPSHEYGQGYSVWDKSGVNFLTIRFFHISSNPELFELRVEVPEGNESYAHRFMWGYLRHFLPEVEHDNHSRSI